MINVLCIDSVGKNAFGGELDAHHLYPDKLISQLQQKLDLQVGGGNLGVEETGASRRRDSKRGFGREYQEELAMIRSNTSEPK